MSDKEFNKTGLVVRPVGWGRVAWIEGRKVTGEQLIEGMCKGCWYFHPRIVQASGGAVDCQALVRPENQAECQKK